MNNVFKFAKRLVKDDEGATAIEYGLLAALISVVIIGAVTLLGQQLDTTFTNVTSEMTDANAGDSTGGGKKGNGKK